MVRYVSLLLCPSCRTTLCFLYSTRWVGVAWLLINIDLYGLISKTGYDWLNHFGSSSQLFVLKAVPCTKLLSLQSACLYIFTNYLYNIKDCFQNSLFWHPLHTRCPFPHLNIFLLLLCHFFNLPSRIHAHCYTHSHTHTRPHAHPNPIIHTHLLLIFLKVFFVLYFWFSQDKTLPFGVGCVNVIVHVPQPVQVESFIGGLFF